MHQYSKLVGLMLCVWSAGWISCSAVTSMDEDDTEDDIGDNTDPARGTGAVDDSGDETADDKGAVTPSDTLSDDNAVNNDTAADGWSEDTAGTVVVAEGGVVITDSDGKQTVCYKTQCDGRVLACGDCIDNDGDGHTDWRDRECLGPCDNTEGPALISDVGGVTGSTCHVDCYFDYGNGMGTGSDDCWWSHECDPLAPEAPVCEFRESLVDNERFCPSEQSDLCTQVCMPFTPNGCDCFGCCTFPELTGKGADGEDAYVWIGAKDSANAGMCTFDDILAESKCPRCTPVNNCLNECGHCEICIGKPELPEDCYPEDTDVDVIDSDSDSDSDQTTVRPPPTGQCDEDITPCSYDDIMPCEQGYYCISGCCQPTISVE
ncbi:MAG: hypothetical protein JXX14_07450 [Deltaproteobacteria bacterium]|nr:hypothetical protein [Deltaproteobacteria bacterium]